MAKKLPPYYGQEKRYVVLEGDIVRASQTTLEGARKYMAPGRQIVISYTPVLNWDKLQEMYKRGNAV